MKKQILFCYLKSIKPYDNFKYKLGIFYIYIYRIIIEFSSNRENYLQVKFKTN